MLLINSVIREFAKPNNEPLGLLYIASLLESHGHAVDICDLNALRELNPDREYWLKKCMKPYDFVGLSGLIVTYKEQRRYLDFIVEHRKDFGDPVILAGGGLATSAPEFTLRNMPELDCIAIGEGELTMLEIVNDPKPLPNIDGLAYINYKGKYVKTQSRELIPDLDVLPYPAWDKVPTEEVYLHNPIWGSNAGNSSKINYSAKRSMNMIISRGCPFSCSFCFHYVFGKKYRTRSIANVIGEIAKLKQTYDVDFIGFVDDNTTADRSWVVRFCNEMIKLDMDIKWGCSARVDQVDPEVLALMKQAGCEWIGFGVESADNLILENMNKKSDPFTAQSAIKMVRDAGMWANATFIAGYPGETKELLFKTAKFMRDNGCLNSMFFATPYPGTKLYDDVLPKIIKDYKNEDNYIKSLADATDYRVNLSEMTDNELIEYRKQAMTGQW